MIDQEVQREIDLMQENRDLKDQVVQLTTILNSYKSDIEQFRKVYTQNKVDSILQENKRLKVKMTRSKVNLYNQKSQITK
jgi:GTPase involved in cell partitioning and DNA repair